MSEYIFTWKIKNFLSCFQSRGDFIQSPWFTVENLYDWCLLIYPYGYPEEFHGADHFIGLSLIWGPPEEAPEKFAVITFSIEMIDQMGNVFKSFKPNQKAVFTKEFNDRNALTFMAIDELAKEMENWKEDTLTLRCRMKFDKLKNQAICEAEACTTIDIHLDSAEWDIKLPQSVESSESFVFSLSDLYMFEIILASASDGLTFSIHLKECKSELDFPMKFKLSLCDAKGNEIVSKRAEHLFSTTGIWKFPDFLTKEQLDVCKVNSSHFELKLKCDISVAKGTVSSDGIQESEFKSSTCLNSVPNVDCVTALQDSM